jgi:hypothetical protein
MQGVAELQLLVQDLELDLVHVAQVQEDEE